ncbi:hypothetical protein LZ30DRAFT_781966 [Colletotrichum cereale]|nr:hypothetical protein LZ30DRAFT_781966 [Colletotrichum cereale]
MLSLMQPAILDIAKKGTQAFGHSPIARSDEFAVMLLLVLYSCIMFLLFVHIASWYLDRNCSSDDTIGQQRHVGRARQRRQLRQREAEDALPIYIAEDPVEQGLLGPDYPDEAEGPRIDPQYILSDRANVLAPDDPRVANGEVPAWARPFEPIKLLRSKPNNTYSPAEKAHMDALEAQFTDKDWAYGRPVLTNLRRHFYYMDGRYTYTAYGPTGKLGNDREALMRGYADNKRSMPNLPPGANVLA